jgi:hypothetical protein
MNNKKNIVENMNEQNKDNIIAKPKRGRKSKQELLKALNLQNNIVNIEFQNNNISSENLILHVNDNIPTDKNNDNIHITNNSNDTEDNELQKPITKKRGRKPKGGKIVSNKIEFEDKKQEKVNVILHLKCSTKDLLSKNDTYMIYPYDSTNNLTNNDEINILGNLEINNINTNPNIDYYNNSNILINTSNITSINENVTNIYEQCKIENESEYDEDDDEFNNSIINKNKEIYRKIRTLENNLHHNNIPNKRCCCFWDTCEFDNPPIYLIKNIINGVYSVYGCFCSTECACAYLFEEKIDSSLKFERYQLLNNTYGKIYNYTKNIHPAPNPYYMLSKFYGNLSIQEYRSLLSNNRLFLILDKPITKIFPELHEDNDEFLLNNKIIPSNNSGNNIKNKLQKKKQTKNSIVNEKFGLSQ